MNTHTARGHTLEYLLRLSLGGEITGNSFFFFILFLNFMLYTGCFAQLCLTLHDPMDCSLPGSFVHGIFQVRILDGLPFPPPGDLNSGIELASPELAGRFFATSATWEACYTHVLISNNFIKRTVLVSYY